MVGIAFAKLLPIINADAVDGDCALCALVSYLLRPHIAQARAVSSSFINVQIPQFHPPFFLRYVGDGDGGASKGGGGATNGCGASGTTNIDCGCIACFCSCSSSKSAHVCASAPTKLQNFFNFFPILCVDVDTDTFSHCKYIFVFLIKLNQPLKLHILFIYRRIATLFALPDNGNGTVDDDDDDDDDDDGIYSFTHFNLAQCIDAIP